MKETALKVRVFGDPALRKKARPVKEVSASHREALSGMAQAMYEASGIGLAAPQVGLDESMIVADIGTGLYKLINPKVVRKEGTQVLEEGCLSVPGVCIKVRRAKKVLVQALDETAQPVSVEAEGLLACVFLHEIDHLKGKLIVDYAGFLDKLKISRRLKKLKETKTCQLKL
jgi:peptide deformylase